MNINEENNYDHMDTDISRTILSMQQRGMTREDFLLLDACIERINLSDSENRIIEFQESEIEKLYSKKIKKEELEKRTDNLMRPVRIEDRCNPNRILKIALFGFVACQKSEDGLWKVKLAYTDVALQYIFSTKNIETLKKELKKYK